MTSKPLSEQLRQAVIGSGVSRYQICHQINLPESSMSRFMNGRSGLSLETIDRLGEFLELAIVANREPKGRV